MRTRQNLMKQAKEYNEKVASPTYKMGRGRRMVASAAADEAPRKKTLPASAGYGGAAMNKPQPEPKQSAKMAAKTKAMSPKPTQAPKPAKAKAAKKDSGGFNFGAAIARGFGGEPAWEREKKKAGVRD